MLYFICNRKGVKIDLDLLCARKLPIQRTSNPPRNGEERKQKMQRQEEVLLKMGLGLVLMENVLRYFAQQKQDVYLNALTNDLVSKKTSIKRFLFVFDFFFRFPTTPNLVLS